MNISRINTFSEEVHVHLWSSEIRLHVLNELLVIFSINDEVEQWRKVSLANSSEVDVN